MTSESSAQQALELAQGTKSDIVRVRDAIRKYQASSGEGDLALARRQGFQDAMDLIFPEWLKQTDLLARISTSILEDRVNGREPSQGDIALLKIGRADLKDMLDRLDGKATQRIDVTTRSASSRTKDLLNDSLDDSFDEDLGIVDVEVVEEDDSESD